MIVLLCAVFLTVFFTVRLIGPLISFRLFTDAWVQWRHKRELQSQWPAAISFLAGSLRASLTLDQALTALVEEAAEPLKSHLRRKSDNGVPWRSANERVKRLLDDPSLELVRSALAISQKSGGQTAALLDTCASILRKKAEMEARAASMAAQGLSSAWVVGLSPVFLFSAMFFVSPEFISPFFASKWGGVVLMLAAFLIGIGLWMANRLAKLEP